MKSLRNNYHCIAYVIIPGASRSEKVHDYLYCCYDRNNLYRLDEIVHWDNSSLESNPYMYFSNRKGLTKLVLKDGSFFQGQKSYCQEKGTDSSIFVPSLGRELPDPIRSKRSYTQKKIKKLLDRPSFYTDNKFNAILLATEFSSEYSVEFD